MLGIFSFRSQAHISSIKYVCRCMAKLSDVIGSDWHLSDKILSLCFIDGSDPFEMLLCWRHVFEAEHAERETCLSTD